MTDEDEDDLDALFKDPTYIRLLEQVRQLDCAEPAPGWQDRVYAGVMQRRRRRRVVRVIVALTAVAVAGAAIGWWLW